MEGWCSGKQLQPRSPSLLLLWSWRWAEEYFQSLIKVHWSLKLTKLQTLTSNSPCQSFPLQSTLFDFLRSQTCFLITPAIKMRKEVSFLGNSPFESNAVHEEYEDTLVFSGSVGNISVGGDVLIDNNGRKMFKDEIMQIICKVCVQFRKANQNQSSLKTRIHSNQDNLRYQLNYWKGTPVETNVILIFDCCRGRESIEMSTPFKPPPTFQVNSPWVLGKYAPSPSILSSSVWSPQGWGTWKMLTWKIPTPSTQHYQIR